MQKGFAPILLLVALALITVVGGAYYFGRTANKVVSPSTQPQVSVTPTSQPVQDETANWKTYTDTKTGFLLKYPPRLSVSNEAQDQDGSYVDFTQPEGGFPNLMITTVTDRASIQQKLTDLETILSSKQLLIKGSGTYNYLLLSTKEFGGQPLYSFSEEWVQTPGSLPPAGGPLSRIVALGKIDDIFYEFIYLYEDSDRKELIDEDRKIFDQILSTFKFLP